MVGFPDTPSPFATVIKLLVPVMVLGAKVADAVLVIIPVVVSAAIAVRSASTGCFNLRYGSVNLCSYRRTTFSV